MSLYNNATFYTEVPTTLTRDVIEFMLEFDSLNPTDEVFVLRNDKKFTELVNLYPKPSVASVSPKKVGLTLRVQTPTKRKGMFFRYEEN